MLWAHSTALLAFLFVGAALVGAGVLVYLWALASTWWLLAQSGMWDKKRVQQVRI